MKKMITALFKFISLFIFILVLTSVIYIGYQYFKFKQEFTDDKIKEVIDKKVKSKELYEKLDNIDDKYIEALLATEDHRFYEHGPFDFISIARAISVNLRHKEILEGGSSITQQLAKNVFFDQNVNLSRKIKEAFMAFRLEKIYEKNEILEFYVNSSYFGSGYYCITEASLGYFGKLPHDIELDEAIFLAGVPNAPSVYDPRVDPVKAKQRQMQVVNKLFEQVKIDAETVNNIKEKELEVIERKDGINKIREEKERRKINESTK